MSGIREILKHINSLPFFLTMKHYYAFDDTTKLLKNEELNSHESWNILRQNHPHFSISEDREEWLKACQGLIKKDGQDGGLKQRSKDIIDIIENLGVSSILSLGVGGAGLEYHIKKARPKLKLICSEYSPVAVDTLKKVFFECDSIILFDMRSKDWSSILNGNDLKKQLCLMYRIDIDFSNEEFEEIFKNMYNFQVENILMIACGRITLRGLVNRLYQKLVWKIHSVPYVFSGFLRTDKTFNKLWQPFYTSIEFECGGLRSFLLKKKK